MSAYTITVADLGEIAASSGLSHAEFCIDQMESQDGAEAVVELREELSRLHQADWAEHRASLRAQR